MKILVEATWGGGSRHNFRLTLPDGRRCHVGALVPGQWDRKQASHALDVLEIEFRGINRRSVRFQVH